LTLVIIRVFEAENKLNTQRSLFYFISLNSLSFLRISEKYLNIVLKIVGLSKKFELNFLKFLSVTIFHSRFPFLCNLSHIKQGGLLKETSSNFHRMNNVERLVLKRQCRKNNVEKLMSKRQRRNNNVEKLVSKRQCRKNNVERIMSK
jgi:hypothetical protein